MEKIKVLVVDDESRMRKLVRDFLEREGFRVLEAGRRRAGAGFVLQGQRDCVNYPGCDDA